MKKIACWAGLAALASLGLSACSAIPGAPDEKIIGIVTASTVDYGDPLESMVPPQPSLYRLKEGQTTHAVIDQFEHIRRCAPDKTQCREGTAKLTSSVFVASISRLSAVVDIAATFEVEPRPDASRPGTQAADAALLPALREHQDYRRALALEYGKPQVIALAYGVTWTVCVSRLDHAQVPLEKACRDLSSASH